MLHSIWFCRSLTIQIKKKILIEFQWMIFDILSKIWNMKSISRFCMIFQWTGSSLVYIDFCLDRNIRWFQKECKIGCNWILLPQTYKSFLHCVSNMFMMRWSKFAWYLHKSKHINHGWACFTSQKIITDHYVLSGKKNGRNWNVIFILIPVL